MAGEHPPCRKVSGAGPPATTSGHTRRRGPALAAPAAAAGAGPAATAPRLPLRATPAARLRKPRRRQPGPPAAPAPQLQVACLPRRPPAAQRACGSWRGGCAWHQPEAEARGPQQRLLREAPCKLCLQRVAEPVFKQNLGMSDGLACRRRRRQRPPELTAVGMQPQGRSHGASRHHAEGSAATQEAGGRVSHSEDFSGACGRSAAAPGPVGPPMDLTVAPCVVQGIPVGRRRRSPSVKAPPCFAPQNSAGLFRRPLADLRRPHNQAACTKAPDDEGHPQDPP